MRKGGVLAGLLMMEAVVWGQGDGRGAGPESTPNDAVGSATVSGKPVKRGALRALFMAQKLGLDAGAEAVLQRLEQPGQISPHEPAVMSPLPVVRAEVIEWLCKDPKAVEALGADGLEIAHVAVLGRPNLDHVRMTVPFRAIDCTFAEGFSAINAKFSLLELSMVRMGKFTADGLQVEGDIRLCNFQATDEVRFAGAAVGKDLYCVNAHFDCPKRKDEIPRVLNLDGAKFEGSVYFRKGESRAGIPEGCTALGEVNMLRIRTKGEVSCENMSLHQPKGVTLTMAGARVDGNVALGPHFTSIGEVRLHGARVGGDLYCPSTCLMSQGLRALTCDHAVIEGSVLLATEPRMCETTSGSFTAVPQFIACGKVSFHGAAIQGDVNCAMAYIVLGTSTEHAADGHTALSLEAATIGGSLEMHSKTFVFGRMDLREAAIGRNLQIANTSLIHEAGNALDAEGVRIGGMLTMSGSRNRVLGGIRLEGASIARDLNLQELQVKRKGGRAIDATGIDVDGSVLMGGNFKAFGSVWLNRAKVRLDLRGDGGQFWQENKGSEPALMADGAWVGGSVFLEGEIETKGRMTFVGANIDGSFVWNPKEPQKRTQLDLRSATAEAHGGGAKPPQCVLLDGYVYQRLRRDKDQPGRKDEEAIARECLQWIRSQSAAFYGEKKDIYWAQPYEQLATVLKNMGYPHAARIVMIQKNKAYAQQVKLWDWDGGWLWYHVFGRGVVSYGYNPWYAIGWSLLVIVFGTFVFCWRKDSFVPAERPEVIDPAAAVAAAAALQPPPPAQYPADAKWYVKVWEKVKAGCRKVRYGIDKRLEKFRKTSPRDEVPHFNPLVYSFETFIPLLKFDQTANWTLKKDAHGLVWFYWYAHILSGWVFTSLLIGAYAGIMKT